MNNLDQDLLREIRSDAQYLVREGGKILAENQKNFTVVKMKDSVDLATSADIASEKFIIDFIKKKYPDHGIYSEEAGVYNSKSEFVWVIDPLDGTKEYSRGLTEYNCLIAVEYREELVIGAMQRNGVNELYSAAAGLGTTLNDNIIQVSSQPELSKAFIGFHVPTSNQPERKISREMEVLNSLVHRTYRVRPGWDDAKCAAWVARGVLDAHIITANVNRWYDIAASIVMVKEAGGDVTDWNGNPIRDRNLTQGMILSNRHIHGALLALINGVN
jgi:myo-inositol-1(or 4)-monophosphatase